MKAKYQTVLERLQQDIASGRYEAGQKLPSEAALVKRFGVSRITIGHAVRELQRDGLVDRVAGSGTYVKGPERARNGLVFGLVIPNLGETEIFEPICQAIAASPDAAGHALLWPHAEVARGVAGVFFAPLELSPRSAETNRQVMRRLREAGIAIVLLDRRPETGSDRERADLAGIDNFRAGYLACDHLRRLGAERIAFIGLQGQAMTVKSRIAGYKEALQGADARIFLLPPEDTMELPSEALLCDGFVCANDRVAARLMQALLARGVSIPEQARVVGMDDVNYARLLPVPLTTVRQPCREIGEAAMRLMLERLARPEMPGRELLVDCDLIVRDSCGGRTRK
jgi:GntR family transcriptional regulator of arabinose operon